MTLTCDEHGCDREAVLKVGTEAMGAGGDLFLVCESHKQLRDEQNERAPVERPITTDNYD